jgi:hypothetical protein
MAPSSQTVEPPGKPGRFRRPQWNSKEKLADGRLPHNSLARIWCGDGQGEMCLACDTPVENGEFVMEGIGANDKAVQFHVCGFYYWHSEAAR